MAEGKFVSSLHVSTERQGRSDLGLDAQRNAVADFLAGGRRTLVRESLEVESGKRADRPKLAEAMALCRAAIVTGGAPASTPARALRPGARRGGVLHHDRVDVGDDAPSGLAVSAD